MRLLPLLLALLPLPAYAQPATVAVEFDRQTIRPVLAEGLADRATGRSVTADDPVRIASISKLVTALGVMRLVDQGKLNLDRDVSDYLGWPLRNPEFPDRQITLRQLLSHQASLLDGGELYIIPADMTLRERLADPAMWDNAHGPGFGWFAYSNINFPVVASVMERVTGERFDVLMSRLVLKPLKLDACFNWGAGCSADAFRRAAILYRASGEVARDDLKGQPPLCPVVAGKDGSCDLSRYRPGANGALFSPQGGLRIAMNDLARIGQMLARGGKGFLSARSFRELTRAQWQAGPGKGGIGEYGETNGFFCAYGLGLHRIGSGANGCKDDLFGDATLRLGHSGEAYGLRSGLWWDPRTGRGLVFFTSAVPNDEPTGRSAFSRREEAVVEQSKGRK
ncbi:serine hydrolase domain-containing protein [Novosphingobium sp.]|uniref:serine hydrolase domain-containing protein n=1 Tax=Novosphingobium sp. TaxID=1874826 RepID=UPI0022CC1C23|nr:serine hydrolase domain-containing protein [Novosphingobium sp.]MCZ8018743.1 serine hydrolase [Novosphingobium sp.]MCZ8034748.1 serine hydrolase [Novosphingobium sp.]MCZ8052883.1 serine hydrolase [Novosphingobium sp.]MCZ8060641.1 serine hydrolase [Novosphingobium sp.]MCZ8230667.1 serine hydrolase [Novosphingobium sp.]